MKTYTCLLVLLAAFLAVASLSAAQKPQPPQTPPLLVIPGDPGRPFKVIDQVIGSFEVIYKVTFTKGAGAQTSYQETLVEALDIVREAAAKSGADAVIHTQINWVPFPDGVIKDEVQIRGARVIGLLTVFGTKVKFLPETPPATIPEVK